MSVPLTLKVKVKEEQVVVMGEIRSGESSWPEMYNTRSTTGIVCLGSFHRANFPDKVRVEHYLQGLKESRKGGDTYS